MTRLMRTLAAVVALVVAVGACAEAVPPSGGTPSPAATPAIDPLDLRYKCEAFPFAPGLLTGAPGTAEQANDPIAAHLRAHLAGEGPDFDSLPDAGWHLTGQDAQHAEFVAVGGDRRLFVVVLKNGPEGWQVTDHGECQPRIELAEGLGAAEWAFDPAKPKPGPATQVFDALVTELSCNSGQPADGRVVGPQIVSSAETFLVIFAVRPRPGGQDCQANPSTRVRVDLGEPLGDRKLLDGGRFPPGDPAQPRP